MTKEQINEKALESYPERYVQMPYCMSTYDANEDHRDGYKKALNDIESLPKMKVWVARDDTHYLHVFSEKPIRNIDNESLNFGNVWNGKRIITLDCNLFPQITWEDEPIEVEILIRKL